jgi:phosphate transport system protein
MPSHTDREYEASFERLRNRLLRMAGRVEEMIRQAVRALVEGNPDLARQTVLIDRQVNLDEVEIDEMCRHMLARWQPMASDLRLITVTFKIVTDLERIADLDVNICERAQELSQQGSIEPLQDIPQMAECTSQMLARAIDAFVRRDEDLARQVIAQDDLVDKLYHDVFHTQAVNLVKGTQPVERSLRVLNVAKYLERMADHCTNVAEQVIFLVAGTDVRHQGRRGP